MDVCWSPPVVALVALEFWLCPLVELCPLWPCPFVSVLTVAPLAAPGSSVVLPWAPGTEPGAWAADPPGPV
jgi:hypothetical protein